MRSQVKTSQVTLLNSLGALVVLLVLCFQFLISTHVLNSVDLSELDSVTYVIENDGFSELENFEKLEFYQVLIRHTSNVSVALHLNKGLTNMFGRANVPHSNRTRYILFQNPKFHCAV
ncbi:MAG: hypothetical protein ACYC1Q_02775 [Bacteroidia bacterium]